MIKSPRNSVPRVALLMQGTRNYERGLLRGIANYSNLHGPWQFYRHVPYLPEADESPLELIRKWRPDALIMRESAPHYYDELLEMDIPTVYVPTTTARDGVANIVTDDREVGRLAARHLYESGIRNFAFCGMNELFFWSRLRCEGFCEQIESYGLVVSVFESRYGGEFLNWNQSFAVLQEWLAKLPMRTGVMVCTDDFSLLVQEAALAAGRSIPEEIALIGVGNDEAVCELANSPLSSVHLNTERAGYDAIHQLNIMLKEGERSKSAMTESIFVSPLRVVARRSTDATMTLDAEVSKAISFIGEMINRSIEVNDVVAAVSLSRRTLYDRFKAATGQTVSAYIRHRRLEHFSRLLLETT